MAEGLKTPPIRGVRAIELEMGRPAEAAAFYSKVWNLAPVAEDNGSIYLRATGAYHHVLALHPAQMAPCVRRIVFEATDRASVDALYDAVQGAGMTCGKPAALSGPGRGYGFDFRDQEGRVMRVTVGCDDHADAADQADRPRKIAHVNLNAVDVGNTSGFLTSVLGFRLIDQTPVLSFFHGNSSDHNCLVVCGASKPTINHVAFELPDLESVMRGAGRMRDAGYPIEWGVGRHGAGNNVFAYFAGPEEFPLEYTAEVAQIDNTYVPRGPDHWRFPPGRLDQWGVTPPHTQRWKRIQDLYRFSEAAM